MVAIVTDRARRRVVVTAPAGTRWAAFHEAVLAAIDRAPSLADYNWIIDDQGPMDDVDVPRMARTGQVFQARATRVDTHTVVVTTDRFFPNWARVIDLNYGGRKHHGAPTLAAAHRRLDQLEAASGVDGA